VVGGGELGVVGCRGDRRWWQLGPSCSEAAGWAAQHGRRAGSGDVELGVVDCWSGRQRR
jgi:hypothetical protein